MPIKQSSINENYFKILDLIKEKKNYLWIFVDKDKKIHIVAKNAKITENYQAICSIGMVSKYFVTLSKIRMKEKLDSYYKKYDDGYHRKLLNPKVRLEVAKLKENHSTIEITVDDKGIIVKGKNVSYYVEAPDLRNTNYYDWLDSVKYTGKADKRSREYKVYRQLVNIIKRVK